MILFLLPILAVLAIQITRTAIKRRLNANALFKEGIRTEGVVVRFNLHSGTTVDGMSEYPVIQFKTTGGTLVELEANAQLPVLNKGERVIIYYEATNPENFVQASEQDSPVTYATAALAWLCVLAGIVIYFVGRS